MSDDHIQATGFQQHPAGHFPGKGSLAIAVADILRAQTDLAIYQGCVHLLRKT